VDVKVRGLHDPQMRLPFLGADGEGVERKSGA
jgi:hypothetical protein